MGWKETLNWRIKIKRLIKALFINTLSRSFADIIMSRETFSVGKSILLNFFPKLPNNFQHNACVYIQQKYTLCMYVWMYYFARMHPNIYTGACAFVHQCMRVLVYVSIKCLLALYRKYHNCREIFCIFHFKLF